MERGFLFLVRCRRPSATYHSTGSDTDSIISSGSIEDLVKDALKPSLMSSKNFPCARRLKSRDPQIVCSAPIFSPGMKLNGVDKHLRQQHQHLHQRFTPAQQKNLLSVSDLQMIVSGSGVELRLPRANSSYDVSGGGSSSGRFIQRRMTDTAARLAGGDGDSAGDRLFRPRPNVPPKSGAQDSSKAAAKLKEMCRYPNPAANCPPDFQQRITQLSNLQSNTVRWERHQEMKRLLAASQRSEPTSASGNNSD